MAMYVLLMLLTFVDPRDVQTYPIVNIGDTAWLGRNLNYASAGSHCPEDDAKNCERLGRLYTWDQAMKACPAGWHLSTEQDWRRLEAHLGMAADEIEKTRGRGQGIGDKLKTGGASGLDIPFAGWRQPDGTFAVGNGHDLAAALWTATEDGEDTAWHRDISSARSVIWRSPVDKPYSLSVRCVRDSGPPGRSNSGDGGAQELPAR